jgi:hypothetical protein
MRTPGWPVARDCASLGRLQSARSPLRRGCRQLAANQRRERKQTTDHDQELYSQHGIRGRYHSDRTTVGRTRQRHAAEGRHPSEAHSACIGENVETHWPQDAWSDRSASSADNRSTLPRRRTTSRCRPAPSAPARTPRRRRGSSPRQRANATVSPIANPPALPPVGWLPLFRLPVRDPAPNATEPWSVNAPPTQNQTPFRPTPAGAVLRS